MIYKKIVNDIDKLNKNQQLELLNKFKLKKLNINQSVSDINDYIVTFDAKSTSVLHITLHNNSQNSMTVLFNYDECMNVNSLSNCSQIVNCDKTNTIRIQTQSSDNSEFTLVMYGEFQTPPIQYELIKYTDNMAYVLKNNHKLVIDTDDIKTFNNTNFICSNMIDICDYYVDSQRVSAVELYLSENSLYFTLANNPSSYIVKSSEQITSACILSNVDNQIIILYLLDNKIYQTIFNSQFIELSTTQICESIKTTIQSIQSLSHNKNNDNNAFLIQTTNDWYFCYLCEGNYNLIRLGNYQKVMSHLDDDNYYLSMLSNNVLTYLNLIFIQSNDHTTVIKSKSKQFYNVDNFVADNQSIALNKFSKWTTIEYEDI